MNRKDQLLHRLRDGEAIPRSGKLQLVSLLSVPAMLAELSSIVMQYIDAMMVGQLGAWASASIGLVSTTCWLFGGLAVSVGTGFCVLVAHSIGAKDTARARCILRHALVVCMAFSLMVCAFCVSIHRFLPVWLGGAPDVVPHASRYFLVWALTVPIMQLYHLAGGMLRSCGNMKAPLFLGILMCALDILFNLLLIPRWQVTGAALATTLSALVTASLALYYLLRRSPDLRLFPLPSSSSSARSVPRILPRAFRISLPMMVEHAVFCAAQIVSTVIVAPLGTVAIAANTIGITVESLCYMPGYGIGDAATTLVGQSLGAKRRDLVRGFSWLTVLLGMAVMTMLGIVMYLFAPELMTLMSSDEAVREVGAQALRIEAFAEPMYAASIVAYGVFVGLGDTLVPCCMNLVSIWCVRIPLAAWLSLTMGLNGVWLAMCIELCFRGTIFLIRLYYKTKR